ncbi:hypothetical protein [Timonella senegalensis]|uniref:hypothetical protein n=1 Tax=Timonella senegalensis TaxID=1465825 RepID=UPI0005945527|nr:hypothetical protein [Timonella senegalensis]
MSKLEPQVGDKVTLTHKDGATVTGVLGGLGLDGLADWWVAHAGTFYSKDGWSVTEVHERPKPEPGTFVKGVTKVGHPYLGVVCDGGVGGGFCNETGVWLSCTWEWSNIASWEVIS